MSSEKYDVGFGKPPKHTQFKPGQSGNPKGRPRKKPYEPPQMTGLDIMDQPYAWMIEHEGLRPVEVSDGNGKTEVIPAFQAVMRSLVHQAARGSRLAATQFAELFSSIQRERREEKQSALSAIMGAKLMIEDHPDASLTKLITENGPDLERVRINPNGMVDFDVAPGELTPEQIIKAENARDQISEKIDFAREKLRFAENELMHEMALAHLNRLQVIFADIDAQLPEHRRIFQFDDERDQGPD